MFVWLHNVERDRQVEEDVFVGNKQKGIEDSAVAAEINISVMRRTNARTWKRKFEMDSRDEEETRVY